jgi:hypothetical protein
MVSKKNMAHKDFRIFVLLNEPIHNFFTYSQLRLHFKQTFCSNSILMSFENKFRIYRGFQILFWVQNLSILSRDIPHFLAQLKQNRHFQGKSRDSKKSSVLAPIGTSFCRHYVCKFMKSHTYIINNFIKPRLYYQILIFSASKMIIFTYKISA